MKLKCCRQRCIHTLHVRPVHSGGNFSVRRLSWQDLHNISLSAGGDPRLIKCDQNNHSVENQYCCSIVPGSFMYATQSFTARYSPFIKVGIWHVENGGVNTYKTPWWEKISGMLCNRVTKKGGSFILRNTTPEVN